MKCILFIALSLLVNLSYSQERYRMPVSNDELFDECCGFGIGNYCLYRKDLNGCEPSENNIRHHNGIDFIDQSDNNIYASASGRVIYRYNGSDLHGLGKIIVIEHKLTSGEYMLTQYSHLNSVSVNFGDIITKSQVIGIEGNTGTNTTHLHFETKESFDHEADNRWGGTYIAWKEGDYRNAIANPRGDCMDVDQEDGRCPGYTPESVDQIAELGFYNPLDIIDKSNYQAIHPLFLETELSSFDNQPLLTTPPQISIETNYTGNASNEGLWKGKFFLELFDLNDSYLADIGVYRVEGWSGGIPKTVQFNLPENPRNFPDGNYKIRVTYSNNQDEVEHQSSFELYESTTRQLVGVNDFNQNYATVYLYANACFANFGRNDNLKNSESNFSCQDIYLTDENISRTILNVGEEITLSAKQHVSTSQMSLTDVRLEYWLSSNEILSSSDIFIGSDISRLGGGVSYESESINYTLPSDLDGGTYYIFFVADATDVVSEVNNVNNRIIREIRILQRNCKKPTGLYVSNIQNNKVTVGWSDVEPNEEYEVQWGIGNYSNSIMSSTSSRQLINLQSDATYQWRVKSVCGEDNDSDWAVGNPFTTLRIDQMNAEGDMEVRGLNVIPHKDLCKGQIITVDFNAYYYGRSSRNVDVEYGVFLSNNPFFDSGDLLLDKVFVSFAVNSSLYDSSDSESFSRQIQLPFDIEQNGQEEFTKYIICVADYNNRFIERDEGNNEENEDVDFYCPTCCDSNAHNYDAGSTAVNSTCNDRHYECETCNDNIQNGDETGVDCGGDICSPCASDCNSYDLLSESDVTSTQATLNWSEGQNVSKYTVYYKKSSEPLFQEVYAYSNSTTLYNLTSNTEYCWYVRTDCRTQLVESEQRCFITQQGISGCTSPFAHNYNPDATNNDDSCQTCFDGIQNGDETDIDCGGTLCNPCGGCEQEWIITDQQTSTPLFQAVDGISTSGIVTVESTEELTFEADYIELNDGFDTEEGAFFEAVIDPCALETNNLADNTNVQAEIDIPFERTPPSTEFSIYPNPFERSTNIVFTLEESTQISLQIRSLNGELIEEIQRNAQLEANTYQYTFDANDIPKGIYFCTLISNEKTQIKKLVIQ